MKLALCLENPFTHPTREVSSSRTISCLRLPFGAENGPRTGHWHPREDCAARWSLWKVFGSYSGSHRGPFLVNSRDAVPLVLTAENAPATAAPPHWSTLCQADAIVIDVNLNLDSRLHRSCRWPSPFASSAPPAIPS